jgi:PIF1-like helicase
VDTTLPEDWLQKQISLHEIRDTNDVVIPRNERGEDYSIDSLYPEQKYILFRVLSKLKEWIECKDFSNFVPLRCTVIGQAGSGKSVLLNTITSVTRKLFQYNNVTMVGCPTGTAAFNAFGETLHRLTSQGIASEYIPFSMNDAAHEQLVQKYKHLLCLIIDERSLLTSRLFGTTAQVISETIFSGSKKNDDDLWGGLPVLLIAGDDYQLPGITEGAFDALSKSGGSRMTQKGRHALLECSKTVFQLSTIRRVSDDRQQDKDLLSRIRVGENISDADVTKIQSLHLDNIRRKHGTKVVQNIQKDAMYLFWTNEKRQVHNLQQLIQMNTANNPTAIIKCTSTGNKFGKAINRHFPAIKPQTSFLCIGATTSLQGKNFCPIWGLHNGACGTVKEIVFDPDQNPNKGDMPKYVVVNFPLYTGPAWDTLNPKVREQTLLNEIFYVFSHCKFHY